MISGIDLSFLTYYSLWVVISITTLVAIIKRGWVEPVLFSLLVFVIGDFVFTVLEEYFYRTSSGMVWFHNLFLVFQYIMMVILYLLLLKKSRTWVYVSTLSVLMIASIEILNAESIDEVPVLSQVLFSGQFIMLSILGFYNIFTDSEEEDILIHPYFWILAGTLFYFGTSLFSWILSAHIFTFEDTSVQGLWFFHNLAFIIRLLAYMVAFIVLPKYMVRLRESSLLKY